MNVQRRLGGHTASLGRHLERLSSGLRINHPGDDAAGLSIASSLDADARVYSRGVKNLNDSGSLVSVADGALGQLVSLHGRMTELAQQAANGVHSEAQRRALDQEAQALNAEYVRIADAARFSATPIFTGEALSIQGGYGTAGSLEVQLPDLRSLVGNGVFGPMSGYARPDGILAHAGIDVGDVNGDGVPDLAMAVPGGGSYDYVEYYTGNDDGTFTFAAGGATSGSVSSVVIGDLNGDGRGDLVASSYTTGDISVLLTQPGGGLDPAAVYSRTSGASFAYEPVSLADFNNDGLLDIAATNAAGNVDVFLNQGGGTFGAATAYLGGDLDLATGDVNGDGNQDIVAAAGNAGVLRVLLGNGSGGFAAPTDYTLSAPTVVAVEVADLNGDGRDDVVANSYNSGLDAGADVLFAGAGGVLTFIGNTGAPGDIDLLDGDGDGDIDLFTFGRGSADSFFLRNNGSGGFTYDAIQSHNVGADGVMHSKVADLNGDGVLDLVGSGGTAPTSQYLVALGVGTPGTIRPLRISLATEGAARQAVETLREVGEMLAAHRGELGASQGRLDAWGDVLSTLSGTYTDARSRIADADVAEAAAGVVKDRLLREASAGVLARVNRAPELALSLLTPAGADGSRQPPTFRAIA